MFWAMAPFAVAAGVGSYLLPRLDAHAPVLIASDVDVPLESPTPVG